MNKFLVFIFSSILLLNSNLNFATQDNLNIPDGTEFVDETEMEIVEQNLDDDIDDFCLDGDDDLDDILDNIDLDDIDPELVTNPTFKQKMGAMGALIKVKMNSFKNHIKGHKTAYSVGGGISCASLVLAASILGICIRKKKNIRNDENRKPKNK